MSSDSEQSERSPSPDQKVTLGSVVKIVSKAPQRAASDEVSSDDGAERSGLARDASDDDQPERRHSSHDSQRSNSLSATGNSSPADRSARSPSPKRRRDRSPEDHRRVTRDENGSRRHSNRNGRSDRDRDDDRDRDNDHDLDRDRGRDRERDRDRDRDNDRDSDRNRDRDRDRRRRDDYGRRLDNRRSPDRPTADGQAAEESEKPATKSKGLSVLLNRTGGAYIPPAKLRAMQAQITDKTSIEYQRVAWEALKKSLNGLVNKVNVSNIGNIVRELIQENLIRGRGLLVRSIMTAQAASPTFTHVFAALVSIINSKFPAIGELLVRRLAIQFKRSFKRNNKDQCLSAIRFIAHLVNHQVAHEIMALEVLTLLLEQPTDDSVEVACGFLKECGQKLEELSPRGANAIFERLRVILHEADVTRRVQYMVEVMLAVRKDKYKDNPAVADGLDMVEEDDQITHMITLEDVADGEEQLNVFHFDADYEENENKYSAIKEDILGEQSDSEAEGEAGEEGDDDDDEAEAAADGQDGKMVIVDQTETNWVALRRTIYLTIQSSLNFEESAHKLMKMNLKPGQELELCNMIMDCCAQLRTYEKFFGLLGERFCRMDPKYQECFEKIFKDQYETIHRLETVKLRNVARFFSHLLWSDALSWGVLRDIKLTEEDTTSSSRVFIKILFQDLAEEMGLSRLNERLQDVTMREFFEGIFPKDNPKNTRFSINYFTSIGLGGLTDDLREHLNLLQKQQHEELLRIKQLEIEKERRKLEKAARKAARAEARRKKAEEAEAKRLKAEEKKRKEAEAEQQRIKAAEEKKRKVEEEARRKAAAASKAKKPSISKAKKAKKAKREETSEESSSASSSDGSSASSNSDDSGSENSDSDGSGSTSGSGSGSGSGTGSDSDSDSDSASSSSGTSSDSSDSDSDSSASSGSSSASASEPEPEPPISRKLKREHSVSDDDKLAKKQPKSSRR